MSEPTPTTAPTMSIAGRRLHPTATAGSAKIGSNWMSSSRRDGLGNAALAIGQYHGMRSMQNEAEQSGGHEDAAGQSVTRLLHAWKNGNEAALGELTPIVYDELLRIARRQLRAERQDHTLAPTALVHEAWMRMMNQHRADWRDRTHFFALAARFMRRILVDYSRNHKAQKRGGAVMKISMDEGFDVGQPRDASIAALDDALNALAAFDERKAKVIELRYFGGLTVNEIADHIGVSVATVGRELRVAQAWLHREMCARE